MKKNSIGNDIVSLKITNAEKSQRQFFYSKFISEKEVALHSKAKFSLLSFHQFIWLCWSAKEAVFKFQKRNNNQVVFSPAKIMMVQIDYPASQRAAEFKNHKLEKKTLKEKHCVCCQLIFDNEIFYTRSIIDENFIFSLANNANSFDNFYWGIQITDNETYKSQSQNVRYFSSKKLKKVFSFDEIEFKKNEYDIPFINNRENIFLSFSHHGKFISYAFAALKLPVKPAHNHTNES